MCGLCPQLEKARVIMASPWLEKVKSQEVEKDVKQPNAKIVCTQYEKNLKKMSGDMTFVKESLLYPCSWFSFDLGVK